MSTPDPATEPLDAPPEQALDELVPAWSSLSEAAAELGVSPNRVRQWGRERQLVVVRTATVREQRVPSECVLDGQVVKGLPGTLVLLADAGFGDLEAAVWLFTPDASLPGRPIDALREDRGREVRRRAQALAF